MSLAPEIAAALSARYERISRLQIETKGADVISFDDPFDEQISYMDAVGNPAVKSIAVVKARKLGISTADSADCFDKTMTAKKPLRTIVATNHSDTTLSRFQRLERFYLHLPRELKAACPAKFNQSTHSVTFTRFGACIDHVTMRGESGGRSKTYQRAVCEEVAFWPDQRSKYGALRGTIDNTPETQWIYISTPNGPGDLFHEKIMAAQDATARGDSSSAFFFFPWQEHPHYRMTPPTDWRPTDDETQVAVDLELDIKQLYWRHQMIYGVDGVGEATFRLEFPATLDDAFVVKEGGWFDVEFVCKVLDHLPVQTKAEQRIYQKFDQRRRYAAGVDPSWCNGGDNAVCCILDDLGEQVAVLAMNTGGDDLFARKASELCARYHAKALIEYNPGGAGVNVKRQFESDGIKLWKTTPRTVSEVPKDWGTGEHNKRQAFADLRQVFNGDLLTLRDHQTLTEMKTIREEDGTIEGRDGAKDDHVMALALAEQCRRSLPNARHDMPTNRRAYSRNPVDIVQRGPPTRSTIHR